MSLCLRLKGTFYLYRSDEKLTINCRGGSCTRPVLRPPGLPSRDHPHDTQWMYTGRVQDPPLLRWQYVNQKLESNYSNRILLTDTNKKSVKLVKGQLDTYSRKSTMNRDFILAMAAGAGCSQSTIAAPIAPRCFLTVRCESSS